MLTYINDTETCTYSVAMLGDFVVCSCPEQTTEIAREKTLFTIEKDNS